MRILALAFVAIATLPAQSSIDLPRLFPAGARAPGVTAVRFDATQRAYLFTLRDLSGAVLVEYRLQVDHPYVQNGVLHLDETTTGIVPIDAGGLTYRTAGVPAVGLGRIISAYDLAFSSAHDPAHTAVFLSHGIDPSTGAVELRYRDSYTVGATTWVSEKSFRLRLFGRALAIEARGAESVRDSADYNHAGFAFGDGVGLQSGGVTLHMPYADMIPVFVSGGACVTRFLDWFASNASDAPGVAPVILGTRFRGETAAGYFRDDTGRLNAPIRETAWVVVSHRIADLLPVIDRPPSEYRLLCAERAVSQNGPGGRYDKARDWVARANMLGVDSMQQIKWDWHKWPFNLNDPDYLPAAPAPPFGTNWGSASDWRAYTGAIESGGWSLAPYVAANMMDPGYPNLVLQMPSSHVGSVLLTANPAYDASLCTRDANGALKKGWDTNQNLVGTNLQGLGHQVDLQAPHSYAAKYLGIAAGIHGANGFRVGGAHIDAQTDLPAWVEIDQIRGTPLGKTIARNLAYRETSFQTMKDAMHGPLLGENSHWRYRAFESFAAGLLDGTSRKIPIHWSPAQGPPNATNRDELVVPDFELGVVLEKATGFFGMGWEYHFASTPFPVPQSWTDGWHTTLLSYGHAPYFSTNGDVLNNYWNWRDTLRSYHLTRGLSGALRRASSREVRYEDGSGIERTLDEAVANGLDLVHPRLVLRTDAGLELKLNHSASNWTTTVRGTSWTIPTDGFVGEGSGGLLALSAINPASGQRVDYAFDPGVSETIDRRGVAQSLRGFPGSLLPIPPGTLPPGTNDADVLFVRDLRRNQAIYATGFDTGAVPLGAAPSFVALRIEDDDTSVLSLGRLRVGLRAIATDQNGGERDVTALASWSSSNPSIAAVGLLGAVRARGLGSATISANLPPNLSGSRAVSVRVEPVVGPVQLESATNSSVMVSYTTDTFCPLSGVVVQDLAGSYLVVELASADPVAKLHRAVARYLSSGGRYRITPVVINLFGLASLGAPIVVTVP